MTAALRPTAPPHLAPRVLWQPFPGFQTRALSCSADEALLGGAAGPGKTDCLIAAALRFAHKPWCKAIILRRHLKDLGAITDRLRARIPRLFPGATFNAVEKRWNFPAGGWLQYGYCKRFADIDQFMGQEYTFLGWDEVGQVPDELWWAMLLSRVRSENLEAQQHCFARASANPGGVGHAWLKRRFVVPCGKNGERIVIPPDTGISRAFIPGRLADNPILSNDPKYVGRLQGLPEVLRRQLLYGDWDAAVGLAFEEIEEETLLIAPRALPTHWHYWGGFDWGFAHPAVLVILGKDEHQQSYVVDTIWMRRLQVDQLAETGWERAPIQKLGAIFCGPDVRQRHHARADSGDDVPTIEEKLLAAGWPCTMATTDRRQGYAYLRDLLSWRRRGPGGTDKTPGLLFFNTPGNRRLLRQLTDLVVDEDNPEDVLKVNADPATGEGGDDGYDALRYGVVNHARKGRNPHAQETVQAFGAEALQHEIEQRRVGRVGKPGGLRQSKGDTPWW